MIMSKKMMKILTTLLMVMVVLASLGQCVLATTINQDAAGNPDQFKNFGDNSGASSSLQKVIGAMITVARVVGTGVAIIMLIVLAIKYISAAPSDKAEIKKHAIVYVVGAVVLFAASGILGIIQRFASNISAA